MADYAEKSKDSVIRTSESSNGGMVAECTSGTLNLQYVTICEVGLRLWKEQAT